MNECFVVVHQNHSTGMTAQVFQKQEAAETYVANDVCRVVNGLKEKGLHPTVDKISWDNTEVNVEIDGVHYKWSIIISEFN